MPNLANLAQTFRPSNLFTTSRVAVYVVASCAIVLAVVHKAFVFHNNFYSVAIFLSRNSGNALVLANFVFVLTLLAGKVMQKIFFGELRDIEVERLYERMWIFLTESLLAFTIFRDEFDIAFGAMFGFLLFIKCFHWLMSDRIEWMDQLPYPGADVVFHVRLLSLYALLSFTDLIMLAFAAESILTHGVGGIVLFASEYAILLASAFNCLAKYCVYAYDQHRARRTGGENAPVWENKSMHLFYIDLVTDFLKLVTYLVFFVLVLIYYGLPLNIIRDVYITGRSFYQRARDLMRYRAATKNMDERYPDATPSELQMMSDKTCIICREELISKIENDAENTEEKEAEASAKNGPNTTPKKLPCGHIFHFHCLRSWLERQQSCPTCRRGVLEGAEGTMGAAPGGAAQQVPPANQGPAPGQIGTVPPLVPGQSDAGPPRNRDLSAYPWPYNQVAVQPQQPLRPAPQFRGFNMGANGAWQPWVDKPRPPLPDEGSGSSESLRLSPQVVEPIPEATSQSTGPGTSANDKEQTMPSEITVSPREAAVQAAMRRAGKRPESITETSNGEPESPPVFVDIPLKVSTALDITSIITTSSTELQQPEFPQLIPLFDPVQMARNARASSHRLPQQIGPEQNEDLDKTTREEIDERLRVLERVNHNLWHSAEELLKLRSTLSPPRRSSTTLSKEISSKGKEKEVSSESDL